MLLSPFSPPLSSTSAPLEQLWQALRDVTSRSNAPRHGATRRVIISMNPGCRAIVPPALETCRDVVQDERLTIGAHVRGDNIVWADDVVFLEIPGGIFQ